MADRSQLAITALAAAMAAPAAAQGFNMTQLLGYGFEVKAAYVGGNRPGYDVLILQGTLPSESRPAVVRCLVRADAAAGANNCTRVY